MSLPEIAALFDLSHTLLPALFSRCRYPWEVLAALDDAILALSHTLPETYEAQGNGIFIHKTAVIHPSASITGPCIIDEGAELRPGAFIRGNVLIGKNAVVGNSCEVKNAVLFDCVQVPHFNYVGDSVLGFHAHMGAGAVTSNVKGDKTPVVIRYEGQSWETNRKKVGAFLGDYAEIGCNSVLNPGTIIGKHARVYPLSSVRGVVPENCIYKNAREIIAIQS